MSRVDVEIGRTLEVVNSRLTACAGGVELRSVEEDGTVRLGLTGMCTGCSRRPLTLAGYVRPALESVPGVTDVQIENSRVSRFAEERLARLLAEDGDEGCCGPAAATS
jgi:Fe-S cluster biogenesis protein NfuA